MKRHLLTTLVMFLISAGIMFGQKAQFGINAGASISNYKLKASGMSVSASDKVGLTLGILVDVPIGSNFSFQPGLNFVQKGSKSEETFSGVTETDKLTVNCLEVPLNILYNAPGKAGKFFVGAGPSFGFYISGKSKWDDGTDSGSDDLKFGNDPDNDDMKGLDIGINGIAGYRFSSGLFFSAGYNAGLNNLVPGGSSDDGTLKSHYFSVKLGIMLGNSKK